MRIYDISQPLRPGIPIWPGDQLYAPQWSARIEGGSSVNVGAVTMSLHTGTHADAPLHVSADGAAIHQVPLAVYVGPAIVIETLTEGPLGAEAIREVDLRATPRVLFKTRQSPPPEGWTDTFAHLTPELVSALADGGAVLVGLDTPSVDNATSTELTCHHTLYKRGVYNLENLNLYGVRPGRYCLTALPLLIEGMDASPVRAILTEDRINL